MTFWNFNFRRKNIMMTFRRKNVWGMMNFVFHWNRKSGVRISIGAFWVGSVESWLSADYFLVGRISINNIGRMAILAWRRMGTIFATNDCLDIAFVRTTRSFTSSPGGNELTVYRLHFVNQPVSRKSISRLGNLHIGPKFLTSELAEAHTRITL